MNKGILFARTVKIALISSSILLVCLIVTFLADKLRQIDYANLPTEIPCISYEPRGNGEPIGEDNLLIEEQIRSDLKIISEHTNCIHTYFMLYGMSEAPKIANEFGMKVIPGIWLSDDKERNRQEIVTAETVLNENKNILFVTVGNETQLFRTVSYADLWWYIEEVKNFSPVPVSTEEDFLFWRDNPEIAEIVDIISVHIWPYWDGNYLGEAVPSAIGVYQELSRIYPDKKIYATEIGWPTNGNNRWNAIPGLSNQRNFLAELDANKENFGGFYNVLEAFDQPWKIYETEGRVGAHWGIWTADGKDKVEANSQNFFLATAIIIIGSILINLLFSVRYFRLKTVAHILAHWFFGILTLSTTWILFSLKQEYLLSVPIIWVILIPSQIILIFIIISHFIQGIRIFGEDSKLSVAYPRNPTPPFVSIHIPCRNENPGQVIACIDSCLKQNYLFFEIIVIDNNTTDPNLWKPVEVFSQKHTEKIKFIHIENLKGFKAGALNLAIKHTNEKASAIAVLDSDYVVDTNWLSKTTPYLLGDVKVVQSPQSYRALTGSLFERAIILEQKMFFEIGMIIRNATNAIIQHGTMCIIDKKALAQVGNWAEWCITEDTELGLRLLLAGHKAIYLPSVLGGGIAPKSFSEYTKQRSRWVFGAVRIVIHYFKDFLFGKKLSKKQKYHFLSGWIFWFAHVFYPLFIVGAFIGTFIVLEDERIFPPLELSFTLIIFVFLEILLSFILVKKITKSKISDIIWLIVLGISTTSTISLAVTKGLIYKRKPFMVTNKNRAHGSVPQLLSKIIWSVILFLGYIILAYLTVSKYGTSNPDIFVWITAILIMSLVPISVILIEILNFFNSDQEERIT